MSRPQKIVIVTGTGTEVGKTWVGAGLVTELRLRGLTVAARKPAQSFAAGQAGEPLEPTDADLLSRASGEAVEEVCPAHRWYPIALAPPMAAEALGRTMPSISDLAHEVEGNWPSERRSVGLVEGAGGVASPLAADGDTGALARALGADVAVVVADPSLGVINFLRLTRGAVAPIGMVAYLNLFDAGNDLHRRNLDWLERREGMKVTTTIEGLADAVLSA